MKKVTHTFLKVSGVFVGVVLANILAGSSNIRAITYSDSSDIQFSFSSTLSIAISDADIVIGNLIPGQDDTSNTVDVVVNTNNLYGYTLSATVGDATKDYRDLRHTNGTTNIASIDVDSDLSTLSGQSSSVWGYTVSTNGTTWSNYNGLPKYDDTQNTAELRTTDGAAADSTTSFKIGAYAEEGQLAGDYTNVINFKVVSNVGKTYMQDVTSATCPTEPTIVYDNRDEEEYTIAQLADGKCWLLDNLRLDLTNPAVQANLTSDTTNASNTTLNYLKNGGGTASDQYATAGVANWTSSSYSYSAPLIATSGTGDNGDWTKDTTVSYAMDQSGTGKVGVYYNYCAASAGSYCYGDGTNFGSTYGNATATEDICPKGWRIPTGGSSGEYQSLYTAYSSDGAAFVNALRTPLSGYNNNGSVLYQGLYGTFWASTRYGNDSMHRLFVSAYVGPQQNRYRDDGQSVRCVLQ